MAAIVHNAFQRGPWHWGCSGLVLANFGCGMFDPFHVLCRFIAEHRELILRQWAKQIHELGSQAEHPMRELTRPHGHLLDELSRLLSERGEDAATLWGEAVRHHGGTRWEQG